LKRRSRHDNYITIETIHFFLLTKTVGTHNTSSSVFTIIIIIINNDDGNKITVSRATSYNNIGTATANASRLGGGKFKFLQLS
jgi:hypothetical protein